MILIKFLVRILVIIITIDIGRRTFKKCKNGLEKIICILFFIVISVPIIMYLLDRYNIPTLLGWGDNLNSQSWLEFLGTYLTSVVAEIVAAMVLVMVTKYQIDKSNEDNKKRDMENLRIQNIPMLKYEIETTKPENKKIDIEKLIISNCDDSVSRPYHLLVNIKNIGLNNVKRIIVDFESSIVKNTDRIVGKKNIIPMEKNESKNIYTYFALETGKDYLIKLNVYYEDVLQNWYYQTVDISYNASRVHNGTYPIGIVNYQVNEETGIDVNEIPKEK